MKITSDKFRSDFVYNTRVVPCLGISGEKKDFIYDKEFSSFTLNEGIYFSKTRAQGKDTTFAKTMSPGLKLLYVSTCNNTDKSLTLSTLD